MPERWRNRGCRMTTHHSHLITFHAKVTGRRVTWVVLRSSAEQLRHTAPQPRSGDDRIHDDPGIYCSLVSLLPCLHIPSLSPFFFLLLGYLQNFPLQPAVFVAARSVAGLFSKTSSKTPVKSSQEVWRRCLQQRSKVRSIDPRIESLYSLHGHPHASYKTSSRLNCHCNLSFSTRYQQHPHSTTKANATLQASSSRSPL